MHVVDVARSVALRGPFRYISAIDAILLMVAQIRNGKSTAALTALSP